MFFGIRKNVPTNPKPLSTRVFKLKELLLRKTFAGLGCGVNKWIRGVGWQP